MQLMWQSKAWYPLHKLTDFSIAQCFPSFKHYAQGFAHMTNKSFSQSYILRLHRCFFDFWWSTGIKWPGKILKGVKNENKSNKSIFSVKNGSQQKTNYSRTSIKRPPSIKRPFFKVPNYFSVSKLQYSIPLLNGQPLLSGQFSKSRGWPLNRGPTVFSTDIY